MAHVAKIFVGVLYTIELHWLIAAWRTKCTVLRSMRIAHVWLFVPLAAFIPKILLKEKPMTQNFSGQYPSYRQQVKAIIPFVV